MSLASHLRGAHSQAQELGLPPNFRTVEGN